LSFWRKNVANAPPWGPNNATKSPPLGTYIDTNAPPLGVGNGSSQHNHKVNKIYNKTKINLQI
jgi:hypothetical protein